MKQTEPISFHKPFIFPISGALEESCKCNKRFTFFYGIFESPLSKFLCFLIAHNFFPLSLLRHHILSESFFLGFFCHCILFLAPFYLASLCLHLMLRISKAISCVACDLLLFKVLFLAEIFQCVSVSWAGNATKKKVLKNVLKLLMRSKVKKWITGCCSA